MGRDAFRPDRAIALQRRLAGRVERRDRVGEVRLVAGADVAFEGNRAAGAVVVLDAATLEVVEVRTAVLQVLVPYFSARALPVTQTVMWLPGAGFLRGRRTLPRVGRDTRPPSPRRLMGGGRPAAIGGRAWVERVPRQAASFRSRWTQAYSRFRPEVPLFRRGTGIAIKLAPAKRAGEHRSHGGPAR